MSGAQEMIRKMGEVCVEPKYDGVRCQIHFSKLPNAKFRVQSYSRNLENTTDMWPELSSIGRQIRADAVILDSEAVGIDPETGRTIPFQETTTRKRKHDIDLFSSQVPVRFYVFDILYKDGSELIKKPLRDRRKILEGTVRPGETLVVTPHIITKSVRSLTGFHHVQLKAGFEGAMVKKWDSQYEPGRRGYNWVKFKETEGKTGKLTDTIDSVVMGYYLGKGKRTGFGIGAFLAGIRSGDGFVTVTKVGTGVSDELWKELHRRIGAFRSHVQPKHYRKVPKQLVPDVWAEPRLVVEIAGDDLTRSPLHGAGFAVRFPRLVRIRTDKSPHQATSVDEVARMYRNQGNGNR
ncbi:hypothetical protein A2Z33_03405 [Candidatus Gottesmanbacteria bacterium RBG_16_52_11]|uniref:DNA ligase n=1 Tax=Candidatus Gottesmanbacteria bacterium RBG_16_52_11 TaxID=1798374 RepID=A0A1F5YVN2_9BACT|nr:MAG: hypothetical protein A2Z33_03405 [Candidatus Gottesmanbacteria bacterium RBG_16_52_11]